MTQNDRRSVLFLQALNGMADTANDYLYDKLVKEWGTKCIRQTDCCGTFNNAVKTHKNFNSTEDAVAAAINAGIQLDYGRHICENGFSCFNCPWSGPERVLTIHRLQHHT